jgi:hypothetical protein
MAGNQRLVKMESACGKGGVTYGQQTPVRADVLRDALDGRNGSRWRPSARKARGRPSAAFGHEGSGPVASAMIRSPTRRSVSALDRVVANPSFTVLRIETCLKGRTRSEDSSDTRSRLREMMQSGWGK